MTAGASDKPMGLLPPMHCLQAFEAVARNRQLTRAAHELGLTKSAIGNSISLLEHRLKLRLVRRYSPTVELTEAGWQYLAATQQFSREIRDALYEKSPLARTQLKVSASRAMGRIWLGPRLADFMRRHPRIELLVITTDRMDSVLGDGVDVALRYGGESPVGAVSVQLMADKLMAVGSPGLLRAHGGSVSTEQLHKAPLIEHHSLPWSRWFEALGTEDPRVEPRLVTTDLHFALNAAANGVGFAIVPSLFALPLILASRLQQVGGHTMAAKPYHAVVAQAQIDRPPMRAFLSWLRQQIPT